MTLGKQIHKYIGTHTNTHYIIITYTSTKVYQQEDLYILFKFKQITQNQIQHHCHTTFMYNVHNNTI